MFYKRGEISNGLTIFRVESDANINSLTFFNFLLLLILVIYQTNREELISFFAYILIDT